MTAPYARNDESWTLGTDQTCLLSWRYGMGGEVVQVAEHRLGDQACEVSSTGDEFGHQDWDHSGIPDFPPGWVDGMPTTSWGQSCAICRTADGAWIHPLDPGLVRYREYDKGHTLPGFWALCQRCEELYLAGQDDDLVEIMKSAPGWLWDSPRDIDECLRKPLAVFRRADTGARPLAPDPRR
jgi:hypothetical protein